MSLKYAGEHEKTQNGYMTKKFLFFLSLSLVTSLLTSCGYRLGNEPSISCKRTLSIPYVRNDKEGRLTSATIHAVTASGAYQYRPYGGELLLKMEFLNARHQNIGYRYDRDKKDRLKDTLIPTEGRASALVEITLIDATTGCALLGPARISAYVDYDHDYYSSCNEIDAFSTHNGEKKGVSAINDFSLGQLTNVDDAEENSQNPLNQILARKIADYIANAW